MGQFYLVVNIDRKEYINPHKLGDGLKLLEFGCSAIGTLTALAVLLVDGNGRGGGDLHSDNPVIGSWAGDRIVIAGDYADGGKFMSKEWKYDLQKIANKCFSESHQRKDKVNLFYLAYEKFTDISYKVVKAMADDKYMKKKLSETESWFTEGKKSVLSAAGIK